MFDNYNVFLILGFWGILLSVGLIFCLAQAPINMTFVLIYAGASTMCFIICALVAASRQTRKSKNEKETPETHTLLLEYSDMTSDEWLALWELYDETKGENQGMAPHHRLWTFIEDKVKKISPESLHFESENISVSHKGYRFIEFTAVPSPIYPERE